MDGEGRIYPKHTESYVRMGEMVEIGAGSRVGSDGGRRPKAALLTRPWDLRNFIHGHPLTRFS